jgi:glyoxalase/bleomycin resistance protein/dioxygenase superfamily protein
MVGDGEENGQLDQRRRPSHPSRLAVRFLHTATHPDRATLAWMLGSLAEEVHLARPRPGVRQDRKRGASMKVCRFGVSTTCSWLCPRPGGRSALLLCRSARHQRDAKASEPRCAGRMLVRPWATKGPPRGGADFRPARKAHPALLVDDLAALVTKLQAAGVTVRADEPLEGCLRVYVDDTFGNRIELMQPDPRSDG